MSLMPIQGYSPNRQDYIDDPDTFNFRMPKSRSMRSRRRPMMTDMRARPPIGSVTPVPRPQPKFGQLQGSSGPRAPSLEEVLSQRGFTMPERPTGYMTQDMAMLGKDPVTGNMISGSSSMRGYHNALNEMYAQNPEALELAKQYKADPFQFGGKPPPIQTLGRQLKQEMPRVFGNQPQQVYEPSLDPAQLQQEQAALSTTQASAAGMPPPQPQPFQPQPAPPQFSQQPQFGQQPQFNQQGMQQMMQFMQQMMQMFSMMSGQGGRGGFGGGFNQRQPMFGGGFGGGFMNQGPYGGGFGRGGYQQPQQPRQRPVPSYPRMQNNYSQGPFGGY